jgi:Recombinase
VYAVRVSHRRLRRRSEKVRRHAAAKPAETPAGVLREVTRVERLVYTRTQAAAALGVSRSTFDRRVLPLIETVEMPWGTRLIPVDELERLLAERRRPARASAESAKRGRPRVVPRDLVDQIRTEREAGRTLRQIATGLNDRRVPTAQGGARWWPSTVRSVLERTSRYQ